VVPVRSGILDARRTRSPAGPPCIPAHRL